MNKLYLHLGTPKTATTAIQYFLHDNNDRLRDIGYEYPDMQSDFPGNRGFAWVKNDESAYANGNVILDAQVLSAYRQGEDAFEDILGFVFPDMAEYYRAVISGNRTDFDAVIAYIKAKLEKNNIIISSENLWTFSYSFLERLKNEFADRVEAIV